MWTVLHTRQDIHILLCTFLYSHRPARYTPTHAAADISCMLTGNVLMALPYTWPACLASTGYPWPLSLARLHQPLLWVSWGKVTLSGWAQLSVEDLWVPRTGTQVARPLHFHLWKLWSRKGKEREKSHSQISSRCFHVCEHSSKGRRHPKPAWDVTLTWPWSPAANAQPQATVP